MILAVSEATVPKISVIVRKAYGAGLYAMCGPAYRPDACIALPTAQIAVMGPDGAVNIIFRRELAEAEDVETRRSELVEEYRKRFANPYVAASAGYIDNVIEPHETRPRLINALEMLENKRDSLPPKKHGNIPL